MDVYSKLTMHSRLQFEKSVPNLEKLYYLPLKKAKIIIFKNFFQMKRSLRKGHMQSEKISKKLILAFEVPNRVFTLNILFRQVSTFLTQ